MLRDCDATFFAIHASSDKQRYVSPIYSMRPAPKSNGKYAVINTSHVIGLFCVCVDGPMTHFHGKLTNLQYNTWPNSFALKSRCGSRLWDSRTSPFICYNWVRHVTKSISKYAIYISRGSLLWSLSRILCLCIWCIIGYACTNCFSRSELQQYSILD